jgi:hypothetical protein
LCLSFRRFSGLPCGRLSGFLLPIHLIFCRCLVSGLLSWLPFPGRLFRLARRGLRIVARLSLLWLALAWLTVRASFLSILFGLCRCGFLIHQLSGLLQTLQSISDTFANVCRNRVCGIAVSLRGLLGQLRCPLQLAGRFLCRLTCLLQLRIQQIVRGLVATGGTLLRGLRSVSGRCCEVLHSQRRAIEPLCKILKRSWNLCGLICHIPLRLLLRGNLRRAVILHLAEGVSESVQIVALP